MDWSWQWKQESLFNNNNYKDKQNLRLQGSQFFLMTLQQAIWWYDDKGKEFNILGPFLAFFSGFKE